MERRTDSVSRQKRSEIMRAVKSRGNKATERVFARILRRHKIARWQRHVALAGNPDFAFRKERVALFIDGCFWHGCGRHCRMPKGNRSYWTQKIASNMARDRRVERKLRNSGWRVLRIWEHDLSPKNEARLVVRICRALRWIVPVNTATSTLTSRMPDAQRSTSARA